MGQTVEDKIMALKVDIEILVDALIDLQKSGQINPGTMEELEVMRRKR